MKKQESHKSLMGNKFTLIELLITIAIIAILAALLLPALNKARDKGKEIKCVGNLKQIGSATYLYFDDYDGWFPGNLSGHNNPQGKIKPYLANQSYIPYSERPGNGYYYNTIIRSDVYICPAKRANKTRRYYPANYPYGGGYHLGYSYNSSYGYNFFALSKTFQGYHETMKLLQIKRPSLQLMWSDTNSQWGSAYNTLTKPGHNNHTMISYVDSHVAPVLTVSITNSASQYDWPWNIKQNLK